MDEEYRQANRALWDEWTEIHEKSEFYDLPGFLAGKSSLKPLDIEEVGAVEGRTLLHLQCHFGMDSLSWARLGAKATGVDFSEKAIALARKLNAELGLDATFLCSDIYELPDHLTGQFDVVYTSGGVLAWLGDLHVLHRRDPSLRAGLRRRNRNAGTACGLPLFRAGRGAEMGNSGNLRRCGCRRFPTLQLPVVAFPE